MMCPRPYKFSVVEADGMKHAAYADMLCTRCHTIIAPQRLGVGDAVHGGKWAPASVRRLLQRLTVAPVMLLAALVTPGLARAMTTGAPEYYFGAGQLLGYGAKCGFPEERREVALARIMEAIERETASAGSDATVQMKTRVYQGQADAAVHPTAMTCDQVQTLWRGMHW